MHLCVAVTADNFCARYDTTCGSSNKWDACDTEFTALTAGSGTGNANTQSCRIYHLGLAETSADLAKIHCPHSSKAGTGQCDAGTANIVVFLVDRNGVMSLENK